MILSSATYKEGLPVASAPLETTALSTSIFLNQCWENDA
jgi:hypothetical protein